MLKNSIDKDEKNLEENGYKSFSYSNKTSGKIANLFFKRGKGKGVEKEEEFEKIKIPKNIEKAIKKELKRLVKDKVSFIKRFEITKKLIRAYKIIFYEFAMKWKNTDESKIHQILTDGYIKYNKERFTGDLNNEYFYLASSYLSHLLDSEYHTKKEQEFITEFEAPSLPYEKHRLEENDLDYIVSMLKKRKDINGRISLSEVEKYYLGGRKFKQTDPELVTSENFSQTVELIKNAIKLGNFPVSHQRIIQNEQEAKKEFWGFIVKVFEQIEDLTNVPNFTVAKILTICENYYNKVRAVNYIHDSYANSGIGAKEKSHFISEYYGITDKKVIDEIDLRFDDGQIIIDANNQYAFNLLDNEGNPIDGEDANRDVGGTAGFSRGIPIVLMNKSKEFLKLKEEKGITDNFQDHEVQHIDNEVSSFSYREDVLGSMINSAADEIVAQIRGGANESKVRYRMIESGGYNYMKERKVTTSTLGSFDLLEEGYFANELMNEYNEIVDEMIKGAFEFKLFMHYVTDDDKKLPEQYYSILIQHPFKKWLNLIEEYTLKHFNVSQDKVDRIRSLDKSISYTAIGLLKEKEPNLREQLFKADGKLDIYKKIKDSEVKKYRSADNLTKE